ASAGGRGAVLPVHAGVQFLPAKSRLRAGNTRRLAATEARALRPQWETVAGVAQTTIGVKAALFLWCRRLACNAAGTAAPQLTRNTMKYVYFTKMLKTLDIKGLVAFCKEVGLDGVDLAVRPGYPVNPTNAAKALPDAAKAFKDAGQIVGFV